MDRVIERFETGLRNGESPLIEASLREVDKSQRASLLSKLLAIEIAHRKKSGVTPTRSEYAARFSEYGAVVTDVFALTPDIDEADYRTQMNAASSQPGMQTGMVIGGKYTLSDRIAEGGMGSVWLARQSEPIKRMVAVKLIKQGMDSRQVLARFDAERQALAMMDHPHIAKVYDGGLHDGRPYFVMELVKGLPITEYCDSRKLTLSQRLELFVDVCQAIQHAHQKGIIHRDIKPTNVLVAIYDDKPVVKVIDFGVAKATGGSLTGMTLDTAIGAIVGTPMYMSPEQAMLNNLDIDTRSDVYALGILLYELLTGSTPFSQSSLEKQGLMEVLRVVREEDPPRPSDKITTADTLPALSANRSIEPKKLTVQLRSELDWIVLKAIEKERVRRYDSANSLSADVMRYLSGEPVTAHPPGALYRLRKFARRYRGQVVAAGLVFIALVAGLVGTAAGLIEARRQQKIASQEKDNAVAAAEREREAKLREAERADGEKHAKEQVALQLEQIKKINLIVMEIFGEFDVRKVKDNSEPLEVILSRKLTEAGRKLNRKVVDDLLVLAAMKSQIGWTLLSLGQPQGASELLRTALLLQAEAVGEDSVNTLVSRNHLGMAYVDLGKPELALPLLEKNLQLAKSLLGDDHDTTLLALSSLGIAQNALGKTDESIITHEQELKLSQAKLGDKDLKTLFAKNALGNAYSDKGDYARAGRLYQEAYEGLKAVAGADHPDTLTLLNNIANVHVRQGEYEKAQPMIEQSLNLRKQKLGATHPNTLAGMRLLAENYWHMEQYDRSVPMFEEVVRYSKERLGADHPDTEARISDLGVNYRDAGRFQEAMTILEEVLALRKARLGEKDKLVYETKHEIAVTYFKTKQLDRSIPLLEEIVKFRREHLGLQDHYTQGAITDLGINYRDAGRFPEGIALLEEALKLRKSSVGENDVHTVTAKHELAVAYWNIKQLDRSIPLLEEVVKFRREKLGLKHNATHGCISDLGVNYRDAGRFPEALAMLEEAWKLRKAIHGDDHELTLVSMHYLAVCHWYFKQLDRSIPLLEEVVRLSRKSLGIEHKNTQSYIADLAINYKDQGRLLDAIPLMEEAYRATEGKSRDSNMMMLLAEAYGAAGKRDEVGKLFADAVQSARQSNPAGSPALAGC